MDRLDCDRMFVAVLEAGSFAGGARRLGVSGGQASKLVSKLEADLGVQLLKRTTRALAPTEVGQAYHGRIKAVLEEFDALDAAVRGASSAPVGRLRVTAPMTFGATQLTPALLDFAAAFPAIQLDVSFSDRLADVIEEGFDLAVRIGRPADASLIARKLCDARVALVAAPAYLEARGSPQKPEDLAAHECLVDSNFLDSAHWRFRRRGSGEEIAVPISGRLRFSSGEACLQAAERGMGLAYAPSFIAGPRLREGRVRLLLPEFDSPPMSVFALYPPAKHLAVKVRALIDFLAERFRGRPEWDQGW